MGRLGFDDEKIDDIRDLDRLADPPGGIRAQSEGTRRLPDFPQRAAHRLRGETALFGTRRQLPSGLSAETLPAVRAETPLRVHHGDVDENPVNRIPFDDFTQLRQNQFLHIRRIHADGSPRAFRSERTVFRVELPPFRVQVGRTLLPAEGVVGQHPFPGLAEFRGGRAEQVAGQVAVAMPGPRRIERIAEMVFCKQRDRLCIGPAKLFEIVRHVEPAESWNGQFRNMIIEVQCGQRQFHRGKTPCIIRFFSLYYYTISAAG